MRSFPGARSLATLALALVAVSALAVPIARADDEDDLRERQERVEGWIDTVEGDLDEASDRVARTTNRLQSAWSQLSAARDHLADVTARLTEARATAARLAEELEAAELRLEKAAAALRAAKEEVAIQREQVRSTVLDFATDGSPTFDLVRSYINSGSVEELLVSQTATDVIVSREDFTLEGLEEAEAALAEQKAEIRAARDEVESKKAEADRTVDEVTQLVVDARAARDQVDALVAEARTARDAAMSARAADRAALDRLEEREARIKQQILDLTEAADPGGNYTGDTGGLLQMPVNGPVTSPFGWRTHPIYGYWGLHDGTDFGAGCGSSLYAGANGVVINTYYDEVYGNRLYLAIGQVNGAPMTLVYNHLSGYNVSEGARVGRGDVVGSVGSTGWSTGCHLHFTVLRNGEPVDPMGYL